jgi:hypothetical protein
MKWGEVTQRDVVLSHEHQQLAWVPLPGLAALRMPEGYKRSVQCWTQRLQPSEPGNVVGREAAQEEGGETPSVSRHSSRLLSAIEAEPPNQGIEPMH